MGDAINNFGNEVTKFYGGRAIQECRTSDQDIFGLWETAHFQRSGNDLNGYRVGRKPGTSELVVKPCFVFEDKTANCLDGLAEEFKYEKAGKFTGHSGSIDYSCADSSSVVFNGLPGKRVIEPRLPSSVPSAVSD
jgi:hypothetical protein